MKKSRTLMLGGMATLCLLIFACSKPEPEIKVPAKPVVKKQIEVSQTANKAQLSKMIGSLSKSESQAFVNLMQEKVPAVKALAKKIQNPKFFPMTEQLALLIKTADNALKMDLPEDEKLKAIEELDGINHPDILDVINIALDEPNSEIREAALDAIMDINDATVVPTVIKALEDEDPELREYALDALMDVDTPEINAVFIKALDDESLSVREAAVDTMLFIESPNILDSLAKALTDSNEDIRDMALITLEDIPDKRSVDILLQEGALNDNSTIREDSMDSLEWITDMEFDSYEQAREWWDKNRESFEFED